MPGSSASIAKPNIVINTAVAESLRLFADELEGAEDFTQALHDLIRETITAHKRIIFNGNGYDDAWIKEATEVRGLHNLRTTPDCMIKLLDPLNADMLIHQGVFTAQELQSRYEIMLENYAKTVIIEANTMIDMARKEILPAVEKYTGQLVKTASAKAALDLGSTCGFEKKAITTLSALTTQIDAATDDLEEALIEVKGMDKIGPQADAIRDEILPRMAALRAPADRAETCVDAKVWPYPTYGDLLFSV